MGKKSRERNTEDTSSLDELQSSRRSKFQRQSLRGMGGGRQDVACQIMKRDLGSPPCLFPDQDQISEMRMIFRIRSGVSSDTGNPAKS